MQDARALVARAFAQRGVALPNHLPDELILLAKAASLTSSHAVGVLLERIVCDGANLEKSKIRNLLWDQEVASTVGQMVDGVPVVLVTKDRFFREAAKRAGHETAVRTPAEYATLLGVEIAQGA